MALLSRLLLLPLLAPLLTVLLVAALNPRPALSLRLLTWSSPALPIGLWLALAGLGGGALSAAATTLALGEAREPRRRSLHRPLEQPEAWWPDGSEARPRRQRQREEPAPTAAPTRPPGEPAPTLSVPYRVIRRAPTHAEGPSRQPSAPVGQGGDGWDQPLGDDW